MLVSVSPEYLCHVYVRSDGLAAVVIADSEYPSRVAFSLLEKVGMGFGCSTRMIAQNPLPCPCPETARVPLCAAVRICQCSGHQAAVPPLEQGLLCLGLVGGVIPWPPPQGLSLAELFCSAVPK